MSINVGIHAGAYVLVAADTLARTYADKTLAIQTADARVQKIHHTPTGFVCGMGLHDSLEAVVDRLATQPPQDVDGILDCINDERRRIDKWPASELRTHARNNSYFFTAEGSSDGVPTVELLVYHPDLSDGETALCPLQHGQHFAIMRPASWDLYGDWLTREMRLCGPDEDVIANLDHHAALLRTLLHRYATEPNPKTSDECQLAVHTVGGLRFMTGVLRPGDPVVWTGCYTQAERKSLTRVA